MNVTLPHWATACVACAGAVAGVLVHYYPEYASALGVVASVCALLAAPTLSAKVAS